MKLKALQNSEIMGMTKGKIYEVKNVNNTFEVVKNDDGNIVRVGYLVVPLYFEISQELRKELRSIAEKMGV